MGHSRPSRPAAPQRPRGPWSADAQRVLNLLNALGSTTFRQLLWQKSSELDLTYAQSQVLFCVAERPGCHMVDVSKAFGVTLSAVTQIVDRLEQKQFMTRGDDPADRRVHVLELTPQGKTLVEELATLRLQSLDEVLAGLSAKDRSQLVNGLQALVEASINTLKARPTESSQ